MNKKISGGDLFFAFQILMAWAFGIPQIFRMFHSTEGMTITWLLFATMFIALNLTLTIGTYLRQRSRDTFLTLVIYTNWLVMLIPIVSLTFWKCVWTKQDSIVSALILLSAVVVVLVGIVNGCNIKKDPIVRGLLVGLFRVVPHLYLMYCILHAGSAGGLAGMTVLAGNITASARIITLWTSGQKSGWDKDKVATLWSECANEGSWLLVTAVYIAY